MERIPLTVRIAVNRCKPGRIAAIDYGTVRIGIAISDSSQTIASPLENYERGDKNADARRFQRLVKDEGVVCFVVGLPVYASGDESPKSRESRLFGAWLHEVTGVAVDYYDERYSTVQAEQLLRDAQLSSRQRKQRRDMLAAQILLSSYLETRKDGGESVAGLDDAEN